MKTIKIGYIDTVHGECPHCHEDTLLVAIVTDFYKCTMIMMIWSLLKCQTIFARIYKNKVF